MTCTGEALHWYWQSPYLTKFSFTIFIKFTSPKPSQVKDNMSVLIPINTTESEILFQARTLRVQIYSNQKEIEYVNLTFQLILEPVLKPVLPSPTFYRPPPPLGVARFKNWFRVINIRRFCPTFIGKYYWNGLPLSIRNKSSKILFKKAHKKYYLAQYWLVCVRACLCFNE